MDWLSLLDSGGAWVVALAIGWAVLTGRLRLDREVQRVEDANEEKDQRIVTLEAKVEALNGVLTKNTDALGTVAETQQAANTLIARNTDALERISRALPDAPPPSERRSTNR